MKIKFAGAAGEVTGSKHMIMFNDKKILLDCGMFQGHRKEADEKNRHIPIKPDEVDSVILSHAHMDHSGLLPLIVKDGYKGPIYCTHATRDLCNYMLADSAYIQEREMEYLKKKKKYQKGETPEPLYGMEECNETLSRFHAVNYEQSFIVEDGVVASFYDAGHILGSSLIHLILYDKKAKKHLRVCFTGDLGRRNLPILRDPQDIPPTDILISESTYGNRLHANIKTVDKDLTFIVNEVSKRGGKLIIPSFALERTQELLFHLHKLNKKGKIPRGIPIYVDSPLAGNVTEVFRSHPECFDKETYEEFIKHGDNPFGFSELKYTRSAAESKGLNNKPGPMIIISASGMCEHGRILHHLKNNLEDNRNTVLIVGYQAANTLGRKLIEGDKEVKIFGDPYRVKASVYVMDAFSGHGDRSDLLDYIGRIKGLKKIFLVHGEETQLQAFSDALNTNGYNDVYIPSHGEVVDIAFG
jgi:metallo-beta-lactamase family protein